MDTAVYWIWLQTALGVGAHQSEAVLRAGLPVTEVYAMTAYPDDWMLTPAQLRRLADKSLAKATREREALQQAQAWVLTPEDDLFTSLFEGMYAPPVCLYAKGAHLEVEERPAIAVVGTRYHDETGRRVTRQIAAGLAAGGAILVSGGAAGLDSEALDAALNEHGVCLSFQACGIDINYPQATAVTRQRVLDNGGLVLTEFPLRTPAYRQNFRIRNRLISAAADGTLVTQAPLGSGALITAGWAREQGKDVYAVPGAVGVPCCEGSNELLKDGAMFVTNAADILMNYVMRYPFAIRIEDAAAAERRALQVRTVSPHDLTAAKPCTETTATRQVAQPATAYEPCPADADDAVKAVYRALETAPKTVTDLSRELSMLPAQVLSALTELELYGAVTCGAGQCYELCPAL